MPILITDQFDDHDSSAWTKHSPSGDSALVHDEMSMAVRYETGIAAVGLVSARQLRDAFPNAHHVVSMFDVVDPAELKSGETYTFRWERNGDHETATVEGKDWTKTVHLER